MVFGDWKDLPSPDRIATVEISCLKTQLKNIEQPNQAINNLSGLRFLKKLCGVVLLILIHRLMRHVAVIAAFRG